MGRAALNGSPNMEDIRISKTRIRVAQNKTVYQTLLKLQNWQQYHIISTKFNQFIICLRLWDRRRYFCRYDWRVLCQRTLSLAKSYLVSWYCSPLKGRYAGLISQGMKRWYPVYEELISWVWRVDPLVWRGPEMKEQWGSTRRHCAVGRSRQRSCLWSCSLLLSPFQHHPRRQLYNSNRSLGSFELTWLPPCGPSTVLLRSHSSKG